MFDEKVILARLQKGESAVDIANEFADLVNKASKTYEKQKKAEAEKAAFQEKKEKELQKILDDCANWCRTYYDADDKLTKEIFGAVSAKEMIADLDRIQKMTDKCKVTVKTINEDNVDKILSDFIKSMNW